MTPLKSAFVWFISALVAGTGAAAQPAPPRVVADIAPVHSLVAQVMDGVATPQLLLSNAASPHDYAMKPSEARMLAAANLVVWTGPSLTPWLDDVLATLAPDAEKIAFGDLDGVKLLPFRSGSLFEAHDDAHNEDHRDAHDEDDHDAHAEGGDTRGGDPHDDHASHDGGIDGHMWLDPRNAAVLVSAVTKSLSERDPANAPIYEANAQRTLDDLTRLEAAIEARLAPVRDRPFVVFHDAYHYFEARFGIAASGAVAAGDGIRPGARRVREIQGLMSALGVVCVFTEPQFNPALLDVLTRGNDVRAGTLDPTGSRLEPGPGQYRQMLTAMADGIVDCLGT